MDIKIAYQLAQLSKAVYLEPEEAENSFFDLGYSNFEWVDRGGTQAAVVKRRKAAVVVYRGTAQVEDWLTDLRRWKVKFDGTEVHAGFLAEWQLVWPHILNGLYIKGYYSDIEKVYFTGHSLGGALATLSAAVYGFGELYTFGSPKVGDKSFAKSFKGNHYRFVNNNDIVARVPTVGYEHTGQLYHFTHKGDMWKEPYGWMVTIDRAIGRFKRRVDGIRDHSIDEYVRLLS